MKNIFIVIEGHKTKSSPLIKSYNYNIIIIFEAIMKLKAVIAANISMVYCDHNVVSAAGAILG